MVDEEVENILAEIRERVRSQELRTPSVVNSTPNDVDGEPSVSVATREAVETSATEALARIDSYLTITSRAWDRLPPLVSNRSGSIAGVELWVKRQIKRAAHWFTWEQINFNAAVHHALKDTVQALETLLAETEGQRAMFEQNRAEFKAQHEEFLSERAQLQAQRAEFEAQRSSHAMVQRKEMDARLSALAQELQERFERLQEEQRVCFKQLSLEATEAAVLEDRARRKTETLLEEFRDRVAQIEKVMSDE
jgi:hypothetical protein